MGVLQDRLQSDGSKLQEVVLFTKKSEMTFPAMLLILMVEMLRIRWQCQQNLVRSRICGWPTSVYPREHKEPEPLTQILPLNKKIWVDMQLVVLRKELQSFGWKNYGKGDEKEVVTSSAEWQFLIQRKAHPL